MVKKDFIARQELINRTVTWLIYSSFSGLVLSQLTVNTANLPQGFEQAKASVIQLLAAIVLFLFVTMLVWLAAAGQLIRTYSINTKLPLLLALLTCFLALTISSIFSPYPQLAMFGSEWRQFGLLTLAAIWVLASFFLCFSRRANLPVLLNIYLLGLSLQAAYGYFDIWRYQNELLSSADYINGQFGQANFLADTLLAGLLIIIYKISSSKSWQVKFAWGGLFLYLLIPLLLTQSRAAIGLGAFLIPLAIFNFIKLKIANQARLLITLVTAIFIGAGLMYYTYQTDLSRQLYWQDMLQVTNARPLIGFGPDTLLAASQDYALFNGRIVDRAHNLLLDMLYSFGIIGTVCFGLLIVVVFYRLRISEITAQECLVVLLLLSFVLTGLVHTKSVFHYAEAMVWLAILYSLVSKSRSSFKAV